MIIIIKIMIMIIIKKSCNFFYFFTRVIEQCAENRMQIQNVAIVFGPTLLWPPNREAKETNMAVTMVYQNQIVEYILQEYHKLFS